MGWVFRVVFVLLIILNLWLGYQGGNWSTYGYKLQKGKLSEGDKLNYKR